MGSWIEGAAAGQQAFLTQFRASLRMSPSRDGRRDEGMLIDVRERRLRKGIIWRQLRERGEKDKDTAERADIVWALGRGTGSSVEAARPSRSFLKDLKVRAHQTTGHAAILLLSAERRCFLNSFVAISGRKEVNKNKASSVKSG